MTSAWSSFVRGAWRQLPVETAILTASAISAIAVVHRCNSVWFPRLLLAGVIATPLAFAAHRLERFGRRIAIAAGALAALAVLAALTVAIDRDQDLDRAGFFWSYAPSVVAAMLVPFVVPGPPFARFVRRFFEQTTTWGVLCIAAIAAVQVVALALRQLFDLGSEELAIDAAIVVGCGFLLIYLHRLRDTGDGAGRIPELWRRLATTIGAPFVTAMLAILVAYETVARIRGELPRNTLSPLILAAGAVGFVSTLIISSVVAETSGTGVLAPADPHRWTRRWSVRLTRAFPIVLLALLPMAWWALAIRIGEHGVTPFRAVRGMGLVCLTCLSIAGSLCWLRGRAALSWQVPATVIGFALVTAFGPLSAAQLSIRSQVHRVGHLLAELEAQWPRGAAPGPDAIEISVERFDELHDALSVVHRLRGDDALRRALAGGPVACSWDGRRCPERIDVYRRGPQLPSERAWSVRVAARDGRIAVPAGELERFYLARSQGAVNQAPQPAAPGAHPEQLWLAADRIALDIAGADAGELALAPLLADDQDGLALPPGTLPLVRRDGTVAADVVITQLDTWRMPGHAPEAIRVEGIAIWRK